MRSWWRRAVPFAALLCAWTAHAGSLSVMPVVVGLSAQKVRESVTVTNRGDERVTTHVEVVSWAQSGGQDVFGPTSDVLLNPGIFTLEPGQTQVLRLGWRGQAPVDTERTYRLLLREVPAVATAQEPSATAAAGGPQVRVLLELRLPVYVAPKKADQRVEWQAQRLNGDAIEVRLRNLGNVHTVVRSLQLTSGSGVPLGGPVDAQAAVLAGQERRWTLAVQGADGADLAVDVRTDQRPLQLAVPR